MRAMVVHVCVGARCIQPIELFTSVSVAVSSASECVITYAVDLRV